MPGFLRHICVRKKRPSQGRVRIFKKRNTSPKINFDSSVQRKKISKLLRRLFSNFILTLTLTLQEFQEVEVKLIYFEILFDAQIQNFEFTALYLFACLAF